MKRLVLHGLLWQGSATLLVRGVRYVAVLWLGGLLSPGDFGVFASLYVFVDGLMLLQGLGLGEALVVQRERIGEAADAVFVLSSLLGLACFAVAWVAAPGVAAFTGAVGSAALFRALAAGLVVSSLRVVPMRLFERDLGFRAKLLPTAVGAVAYLVASVLVASHGGAVWSFVAGVLAASVAETVAFWLVSPWRPTWHPSLEVARPLVRFGAPVVLGGILTYLFGTVDRLALVRWGGSEALGLYAFAFALTVQPASLGAMIAGTVLLPSYGALASDPDRRLRLQLRATAVTAGAGTLFAALAVVLGGDLLRVAYGTKWVAAIPTIRLLAVGAVFRALATLVGDFLMGIGRPRAYQAMNALQLGLLLAGLPLALARGGSAGVALVMGIASLVALLYGWAAAGRALGVPVLGLVSALSIPARAGATGTAALVALRALLPGPERPVALGVMAAGFLVVFAATWWLLDADLRSDVRRFRRERMAS